MTYKRRQNHLYEICVISKPKDWLCICPLRKMKSHVICVVNVYCLSITDNLIINISGHQVYWCIYKHKLPS